MNTGVMPCMVLNDIHGIKLINSDLDCYSFSFPGKQKVNYVNPHCMCKYDNWLTTREYYIYIPCVWLSCTMYSVDAAKADYNQKLMKFYTS